MASEVSKVRFVRCPKCHQVLTEFADVPVYKCGGCGTILRAKHWNATKGSDTLGTLESISSQKNISDHSTKIGGPISNDESTTLSKQTTPFSTDANSSDMELGGEKTALPTLHSSHSNSEHDPHKNGVSSEIGGNEEIGSAFDCPRPTGRNTMFVDQSQQDEGAQSKMASCSNEQVEESLKLIQHGSGKSRSGDKIEGSAESTDHSVGSEEGMIDRTVADKPGDNLKSPTTRSSHAYDGSVSSYDDISNNHVRDRGKYLLLSRRTFRRKIVSEPSSTKGKEEGGDTLAKNNTSMDSEAHIQERLLSAKSSNERYGSAIMGSFDSNRDELSSRYAIRAHEREASQDTEDFHSVQNWMELEKNAPSRSLSRDAVFHGNSPPNRQNGSPSEFTSHDRMELLRKLDELRDQLSRPYNRRSHIRGTRPEIRRTLFSDHDSEQEILQRYNSNIHQRPPGAFGLRTVPQQYQFSPMPSSKQADSSCLHCHPEDWRNPTQLPPGICCNNGLCRACPYHMCHHPSNAAGSRCHKDCNACQCCRNTRINDHELEKLHHKEKCQRIERHCRPVSGGAPFVICYKCLALLQLPIDFLVSRRRCHKLRCAACSKVLIFSSHDGGHIVHHSDTQMDPPPSEVDDTIDDVSGHGLSVPHANDCLQGDPVSYSEEYGPPFSKSYSTEGEPVPHILRSSSEPMERRDGKRTIGSPLHRLMGYSSASELINQHSDGDEGYESTDMARFYRTSDEIHMIEGFGGTGTGTGSSLQEHSAVGSSPDYTEIREKDEFLKRSTDTRGGSPHRGFIEKGIKELNHGLESMRLKIHANGRVIPAPQSTKAED